MSRAREEFVVEK